MTKNPRQGVLEKVPKIFKTRMFAAYNFQKDQAILKLPGLGEKLIVKVKILLLTQATQQNVRDKESI